MSEKLKGLTMQERKILADKWRDGQSAVEIAVELGRSPAAIYTELKRGDTGELDANKRPKYDPERGQEVYQVNMRNKGRRKAAVEEAREG